MAGTLLPTSLISWYQDGQPVQPRLPLLSAWLGHIHPDDTYWYLQAVPELLTLGAARRDDREAGPQ